MSMNSIHRVHKLKEQFAYLYVVVTIPTEELNESFIDSYFAWVPWLVYSLIKLFWTQLDMEEFVIINLYEVCFLKLWRSGIDIGRPTFISVLDMEMGFEKIVKIVHVRGGKDFFFWSACDVNLVIECSFVLISWTDENPVQCVRNKMS